MKITYDDQYLITVSEDSSIILWKIQDKEGRGVKRDKDFGYAEEILITKSDLEEKNSMMAELKTRCEELKMENGYQLRLKDMNYNEKIKELTEKFIQEMESLKTKNQVTTCTYWASREKYLDMSMKIWQLFLLRCYHIGLVVRKSVFRVL